MTNGNALRKMQALGRLKKGQRNKTEAEYEQQLELQKRAGELLWFRFEGMKLRLADNTFLTPDFAIMLASGEIILHDVKGFLTEDAHIKMKIASEMYPFRFFYVRKKLKKEGGGFLVTEV